MSRFIIEDEGGTREMDLDGVLDAFGRCEDEVLASIASLEVGECSRASGNVPWSVRRVA